MDKLSGFGSGKAFRRQRTNLFRRPQNNSQSSLDCCDNLSISSTPRSDSLSKASSNDNIDYGNISRMSYSNLSDAETALKQGVEDGNSGDSPSAEARLTSLKTEDPKISGTAAVSDRARNDNKFKKVKLKVGGVTKTIHTISVAGSSSTQSSFSSDPRAQELQENAGGSHSSNTGKRIGLRGIPWKDFAKTGLSISRVNSSQDQLPGQVAPLKQFGKHEGTHKSKTLHRSHLSGETFNEEDDEEDDDEIRYLDKLKFSKSAANYSTGNEEEDEHGSKKLRKISRVLSQARGAYLSEYNSLKGGKGFKKYKSVRESLYTDYEEAVCSGAEVEPKKRKQQKEFIDVPVDGETKMAVTTRQRALLTGPSSSSSSAIEFPHGLPPPPSKKQKEQLSEVEQQLKKAEAAKRRRMHTEKIARESEAEAIRKILGQDSSRKKREEKLRKRQDELAQERTAATTALSSTSIRWVMSPSGTVVTFPNEMGLPSIFEPKPSSYPPPREKCAGPSCGNTYKYRDSKSKLPLCSLQCYKAIREKIQPLGTC